MPSHLTTLRQQAPQVTPQQFLAHHHGCWLQYYDDTPAKDCGKASSAPSFQLAFARRKQQERCAITFSLQAFKDARTKENVTEFRNLGVDVDLVPPSERASLSLADIERRKDEYLAGCLLSFPLKPHWLIETRHGFHAIFRVMPRTDDDGIRLGEDVNRKLVAVLKGDDRASLLTQVLRVPGTYQFKEPSRPFLCRLLLDNSQAVKPYPLEEVRSVLDALEVFSSEQRQLEKKPDDGAGKTERAWQSGLGGVPEGQRNATAASIVGGILARLPEELWETAGWGGMKEWNQKNPAPLPEKELRSVFLSIGRRERAKRQRQVPKRIPKEESDESAGQAMADRLVRFLEEKGAVLFHDQFKEGYAVVASGDHRETLRIRSREFEEWLSQVAWEKGRRAVSPQAVKTAIATLAGTARFQGRMMPLEVRVARQDGALWYDLAEAKRRAVRITEKGWDVVEDPPILFRRFSHELPQVSPMKGGSLEMLKPFFGNLREGEQLPLLLMYVVTCFLPGIAHPAASFYGPWGCAKSTCSAILRSLIDPSALGVLPIPELKELPQVLYHHWYPVFDNVRAIAPPTSDALCRAVTGIGNSKRSLFTDDEDAIYQYRRCLCFNGINLPATEPDLLRRSLLFPLEKIPPEKQRTEREVLAAFEAVRPQVLGAVFDALAAALRLRPSITLRQPPGMADFAEWGCAVAEAVGYGQERFLKLYQDNIDLQHEEAITESAVGQAVADFMDSRSEWQGTATELLRSLAADVESRQGKMAVWALPRIPKELSRQLNILKGNFEQTGIRIEFSRSGSSRRVILRNANRFPAPARRAARKPVSPSDEAKRASPQKTQEQAAHEPRDARDARSGNAPRNGVRHTDSLLPSRHDER